MRPTIIRCAAFVLILAVAASTAADDMEAKLRAELAKDSTNSSTLYNLACAVSLDNRPDEAMELLERSIMNGFMQFEHLLVNDQDLNNCRKDTTFHGRIVAAIEKRKGLLTQEVQEKPYVAADNYYELAMICVELKDRDGVIRYMQAAYDAGFDDFMKMWNAPNLGEYWKDSTFRAAYDAAYERAYAWTGSDEQKLYGLMQVWSEAKYNFAYFDQIPSVDWDALCRSYIPKVLEAQTIDEYYFLLMELAAQLQDGHTGISPPWAMSKRYDYLPIELALIDGRMYVERIGATDALSTVELRPGMELVEVDGSPVVKYFDEHVMNRYCFGRPMGTFAIGQRYMFWGPKDEPIMLTWRDFDGGTRSASVMRGLMLPDSSRFKFRTQPEAPYARFKFLDNGIVYCNLMSMQYSDLDRQFREVFDTLDLTAINGFILDVRENGGGSSGNGFAIISHFIDSTIEAAYWKTRQYMPTYAAWGRGQSWYDGGLTGSIQPADGHRYTGPLAVLIGPRTFSAAEDFVVPLDFANRAVLVGDSTGGSTGQPLSMLLPGGGSFRVCTKRDVYPDGSEFVGRGIGPDVRVLPTAADIRTGRDAALEKAVEVVENWQKYHSAL